LLWLVCQNQKSKIKNTAEAHLSHKEIEHGMIAEKMSVAGAAVPISERRRDLVKIED